MGGFIDRLFGSPPDTDYRQMPTQTPEQRRLMNESLIPYLEQNPGSHAGSFQSQEGNQFSGGMTGGEWASLDALEQRALNPQGPSQGQQFLQQSVQGGNQPQARTQHMERFLNEQPGEIDDYFQKTVANPLMEQFQEDILPQISRRAAGSGNFYGSDRAKADSEATEDLLSTLGRERSRMAFDARESAQNRGLQASQFTSQVESQTEMQNADRQIQAAMGEAGIDQDRASLELQTIAQNLSAQGIPREQRNQELAKQYADFLRQEGARDTHIAQILSALGLQAQENIITVEEGSSGLLGSFLGGGGASAIMGMF